MWSGGVAQSSEVYIFYTSISPPITVIYLSCAVPGGWGVSTARNERKERSVFYVLYISQKPYFSVWTSEGLQSAQQSPPPPPPPPSADILWTGWWEMFQLFCLQKFKNVWLIRSLCCRSCPADWACHKGGKGSRTVLFLRVHVCENARHLTEYLIGNGNNL